jgi:Domain of Unknown Function (DUF748)
MKQRIKPPARGHLRWPWGERSRWWLVGLGVLGLVLVGVHAVAEPVARWQTRRWIEKLGGIQGDFLDARLSFFPLVYGVTHLKLSQPQRQTKEPLFYADHVSLQLLWGKLLTGHLVARVDARGVKVVLEQPAPGTAPRLPDLATLIPVEIVLDRLQAKDGEVLYVWVHQKYRPTMWFHDIEATLENLGSRPNLTAGPMTLSAAGIVQRKGRMSVVVRADPFAMPPSFAGRAQLEGFDVSQMNALIDSQKDVKLAPGLFGMRMGFESKQGKLTGQVDPRLETSEIVGHDANLGSAFKALLGRISMAVSTPADGTTPSGVILIRDDLTRPDRQLLLTMEKVVENGFLLGLQEGLKRVYAGGPPQATGKAKPTPTELKTGQ